MAIGRLRRWARRRHLTLLPVGTTCCAAELDAALGTAFDPVHHGLEIVDEPSVADVLIVAGRLSTQMAKQIVDLHERMPVPARVIAFGSCAISGGAWADDPDTVDLTGLLHVDAHIPGCCPPPQHLYEAIESVRRAQ